MNRILLFIAATLFAIAADTGFASGQQKKPASAARDLLPVSIQFSPQSESSDHPVTPMRRLRQQSIRDIRDNGFTNLWIYHFSGDSTRKKDNDKRGWQLPVHCKSAPGTVRLLRVLP